MLIRRSLTVATVFCAPLLFACSASGPGENVSQISQPFQYNWAGTLTGKFSKESVIASRGPGLLDLFVRSHLTTPERVYFHRYTDATGWNAGVDLAHPNGVFIGSLAVTQNGGRLDLFATGGDGKIYHKVSSQTPGAPSWPINWYQVPGATVKNPGSNDAITVTSWAPGRLDLFWVTPSGNIGHKWADNYV